MLGCSEAETASKERENEPNADTQSFLDDLAKDLSDDETTGPSISQKLADITLKRWGKQMSAEKLKSILEKYARPENCSGLICKRVNPEIWQLPNSKRKRTDVQLYNLQQTVLKVVFAILQTTNTLVESKHDTGSRQLFANLIDAIAMLAHTHSNLSLLRKDQIKPALKQEYSAICALEDQPDSKLLLDNDLAKNLKEAKEASHISSSMKNSANRPYSTNKKPAPTYKQGNSAQQQKFFMARPAQKHTEKEKILEMGTREEMVDLLKQIVNTVSEFEKHIPEIISYLQSLSKHFRAGRIAKHFSAWINITNDKEILTNVTGVKIECSEEPVGLDPPAQKLSYMNTKYWMQRY